MTSPGAKLVSAMGDLNDFTLSANSAIGSADMRRVVWEKLYVVGSSPFPAG